MYVARLKVTLRFACLLVLMIVGFSKAEYIPPSCINRISNDELDIIISQFKPLVIEAMQTASIPDLSFTTQSAGMSMRCELNDIVFQDLNLETIWVTTVPGVGYSAGAEGGSLIVRFSWVVEITSYPYSYMEGSGVMVIDDLYGSTIISVTLTEDHVTVANVEEIHVTIGKFSIDIESDSSLGGLISVVIDVLSPYLSDYIGNIVGELLADAINTIANGAGDNTVSPIDEYVDRIWVYVNGYEFKEDAGINPIVIMFVEKGGDVHDIPYNPNYIPDKVTKDVGQIMFDFEIFNSAWFTYMKIGYFHDVVRTVYGKNLTVDLFSDFFPELLEIFRSDSDIEVKLNCPKLLSSNVCYTGIFRLLECTFDVNTVSDETYDSQHILTISGTVGLAEQPKIYCDDQCIALSYYYNSSEVSSVELSSIIQKKLDDNDQNDLLRMLAIVSLLPFVNEWGKHVSISIFSFAGMKAANVNLVFTDTYVAVGFTPVLDL